MKKFFKKVLDFIVLIITGHGNMADQAVKEGIVDFSGQGRDKYGK